MKKSFLIIPFLLFSPLFSESIEKTSQEIFSYDRMITIRHPHKAPPAVPRYLIPENPKFLLSSDLRSNFYSSLEAFLVMEFDTNKEEIEEFYRKNMQSREWKLLQSDSNEDRSIFLSEGFSRKVITVYITKVNEGKTKVKFFYKKNSNY